MAYLIILNWFSIEFSRRCCSLVHLLTNNHFRLGDFWEFRIHFLHDSLSHGMNWKVLSDKKSKVYTNSRKKTLLNTTFKMFYHLKNYVITSHSESGLFCMFWELTSPWFAGFKSRVIISIDQGNYFTIPKPLSLSMIYGRDRCPPS